MQDLASAAATLDPVDDPELELTLPVYDKVLDEALTLRPELEIAKTSAENAEDLLRRVKNERLPTLDLQADYAVNGQGESFSSSTRAASDG